MRLGFHSSIYSVTHHLSSGQSLPSVYNGVTGAETCGEEATSAASDLNAKLALANVTIESLCQDIYDDAKARTVSILMRQ